ncbi:hypothetical protein [Pseudoflavonifractor sp. 60]|uniref:hypothetical protein n=1 Tax=Pseudoflavonifractor sp. 60 TaxID=2304576 RepID=UPI00136A2288|nr:hypothetical protein [Pseudoflavonifractor sp. 60]
MRRLTALLAAMVLLLTSCGGKNDPPQEEQSTPNSNALAMTMTRTRFSQETEDILKLLEVDGGFYDFCVDDSVNGFSMNVWVLTNGAWVSSGEINGKVENRQGQIGVQLLEDGCNFFQLDNTGHTKYSVKYTTGLKECAAIGRKGLNTDEQPAVIEPGKEQFLFMELGWKDAAIQANMMDDFRSSSCDAGVAATITFTAAPAA